MFIDDTNEQGFTLLTPGTHRMKVTSWEVKEDGNWTLTFQKGGFKTTAFGKYPFLKEEGNPESWMKVVGPKGGWLVGTKIFFEGIMGKDEVNQALMKAEQLATLKDEVQNPDNTITKVYYTFEEQWASLERVKKSVKILIECLLNAAESYFKQVWFDVDLEEKLGIDKEGNEKTYLNIAKKTAENGYKEPYRISKDQTDEPVPEPGEGEQITNEEIPDWVNEESQSRTEPTDSEW